MEPQNLKCYVGGTIFDCWHMRHMLSAVTLMTWSACINYASRFSPCTDISFTCIHIHTTGVPSSPINARPSPKVGRWTILTKYNWILSSIGGPWKTGDYSRTKYMNTAPKRLGVPGELWVPMGKRHYIYNIPIPGCMRPKYFCSESFIRSI